MAKVSRESDEVNARIVYWGVEGSGKTANLYAAYARLRPDHRGELREVPSRLDPTVAYEVLPIQLGEVAGIRTQIEMIAVPGAPEQAPTRKQLLDQVDGIVFVADASPDRLQENLASWAELQNMLASYGRALGEIPLVVQYNKRDRTDAYALEDLHRKLDPRGAAVFEAVASEGTGVLQTLSTISKRVIRALRETGAAGAPAPERAAAPTPARAPEPTAAERMERAILTEAATPQRAAVETTAREAETLLERPWTHVPGEISRPPGALLDSNLSIVSVGEATRVGERSVRVPIVLGDGEGGTSTLVLTIQLDALVDEDTG
jgi:signal recognition particle receptor subunit beta